MHEHISLTLPKDVVAGIDQVAALAGTTRSVVIQVHLAKHFRAPQDAPRSESRAVSFEPAPVRTEPTITLPETGFLRLTDIIGRPQGKPGKGSAQRLIPVAAATWWKGVKTGKFPQPVKLGGATVWRVEDIRSLIEMAGNRAQSS